MVLVFLKSMLRLNFLVAESDGRLESLCQCNEDWTDDSLPN